ncbi:MAG: hypothetical protein K2L41_05455, partial [Muribaculaceae bacterium]|nr:hypothetical protein [Muribaculaceae bacterium]
TIVASVIGSVEHDSAPCVALNYAISMALTGRRTILVEANPFKHTISKLIDINQVDEITHNNINNNYQASTITLDNKGTAIDYMQCALDNQFGDDLIESVRFEALINQLSKDYEIVIISSPSIDTYYPAVERLNGISNLTFVTIETGKSTKNNVAKISHLNSPESGLYLIEISSTNR